MVPNAACDSRSAHPRRLRGDDVAVARDHLERNDVLEADEAGHEGVGRAPVEHLRPVELHEPPGIHDRDTVGDREGLLLVVRDIDRGGAVGALELADLDAHVDPELRIEVGERLVEHQQRRLDHQRARESDALLLTARERAGQPGPPGPRGRRAPASPWPACGARPRRCRAASGRRRRCRGRRDAGTARSSGTRGRCRACGSAAASGRARRARSMPLVGDRKPAIRRKVVVLPQPLAPRSETSSPAWTESERSSRTLVVP